MKHKILLSVLTLAVFVMAGANVAEAETIEVLTTSDEGTGSLRQAIADAADGDEITFACSLDGQTITLKSALVINKSLTIKGRGQKLVPAAAGDPAIHIPDLTANGAAEPITSISRIWFDGFNNTGGAGRDWGGAISSGKTGTIKLYSCIFTNNTSKGAGGAVTKVWSPNGPNFNDRLFAYGCTFYNNGDDRHTFFLHEEPPVAMGNIFVVKNSNNAAFEAPNNDGTILKYNAFNTTLLQGATTVDETNIKYTTALPASLIPTDATLKILPTPLPAGYPTEDFYGNAIAGGGFAGALQAGYTPDPDCANIPVTGISLDFEKFTIERGIDEVSLIATIEPLGASNQEVTWSSDDEAIATVDQSGVVTGVAVGKTTITVTTKEGEFKASATVTVIEPPTCRFRYDRTGWTATYGSAGNGRKNTPTIMFDDNYVEDGEGWHNAATSGKNHIREAVVVDMGETKDIGTIVFYSTAYLSDIVIYTSSNPITAAHDTSEPGEGYSYPIGSWNCPETDAELDGIRGKFGEGEKSNSVYRIEIPTNGTSSSRYIAVAFLNTRGGGEFAYEGAYCNMVEFDVYPPCDAPSWEIGEGNAANVIASVEGEILYIRGEGAMQDFPAFINELGYTGSGAPWMVNIKYEEDSEIIESITKNPISTAITEIIIEEGVTNIGANFAWDNDGDVLPNVTRLTISEGVTDIGSRAFNGVPLEEEIVIPEGVITIGDYAFDDNGRGSVTSLTLPSTFVPTVGVHHLFDNLELTDIYIAAETPPVFSGSEAIFTSDTYDNAKLHVPSGAKTAYEAAEIWKEFDNIVEATGEIPVVELPYTSADAIFADDIVPFLTGSYADAEKDGVVAVAFTVENSGKLEASVAIGYTIYLFDDESVDGDEIAKGEQTIVVNDLEAGTYYLVVDNYSEPFPLLDDPMPPYNLTISFTPTGIDLIGKAVKSVIYYDLLGRTVNSDAKGIIIKKITYDDGSTVTEKVYVPNK